MTYDEFNKKHLFHTGYCCGNCRNYVPNFLTKEDGEMVAVESGRCRHPDMDPDRHGVNACDYCVAFDDASWWGDGEAPAVRNLREFLVEEEKKFQQENKDEDA